MGRKKQNLKQLTEGAKVYKKKVKKEKTLPPPPFKLLKRD